MLQEVRLRVNVSAELVPGLHIGEIAPSLSGNHYLSTRSGHLLKYNDPSGFAVNLKLSGSSGCSHKARSTSTYNNNISRLFSHSIESLTISEAAMYRSLQ
jgi:hypothetical protein